MKFYDREKEMAILRENEQRSREAASFTVLMGRRRIGKTSLVMQTFRDMDYAYLFVSRDSEAMLCQKFQHELSEQLGLTAYGSITRFRDLFEMVMRESTRRHFTVVIDEFQNLYRTTPAIFGEMQDVWDRHHRESHINLIVCGSIHSLMKRIFEDKGEPLYGRPTSKFTLHAFPTHVLRQIMADNAPTHQPDDLLCLYMLTGGVAKYVELLVDGKHLTKERMLDYVCRPDSYFLTEGRDLLSNEFTGEFSTYFSVLQLIAGGMTRRAEIDGFMQKDMGVYLNNLEKGYEMVARQQPLFSKPGTKTTKYEIRDHFLRFWFRFVFPCQSLVERQQYQLLRQFIAKGYDQFTGRTLERYFQDKLMESGRYTQAGNWWDRKGENELDLVAVNEFDHTGTIAEVKRNAHKISLTQLREKAAQLPTANFSKYDFQFASLSLEDM